MPKQKLPLKGFIVYGIGCLGWSISINLISVLLNYIYLPPTNSGMKNLIPPTVWLGFINIIAIILFIGRGFDVIIDPLISNLTDRSKNKSGRRVPFMRYAFFPVALFCALIFCPPHSSDNSLNIYWLAGAQLAFYFFYGMYTIPYNALLADIGHDDKTKLNLSTAQSVGFITGILFASSTTVIVKLVLHTGLLHDRLAAYQYSIGGLNIVAAICLAVPAFLLDETKYADKPKSTGGLFQTLKVAFANRNFRIFVLADASYFMSIAIIGAGLLYYLKSMLRLGEEMGSIFMLITVLITLAFYALVNWLGRKFSRKKMIIISFSASAIVFSEIFLLGKVPISPIIQASVLVVTYGIPNAFLQVLPTTIMADISNESFEKTKQNEEGMFFGLRAFFQKIGQAFGVTVFAMLTTFGKDPGHDWGLRLSGIAGALLCVFAAIIYTQYKEKNIKKNL